MALKRRGACSARSTAEAACEGAVADRGFRVVVAGAGVAGLFMAETLKRAGIDFAVYEKAGEVGGTWRDNTFPGLFVDVLSRQYEFPFQQLVAQIRARHRDLGLHQKRRARPRPHQVHPLQRGGHRSALHRWPLADRDRQGQQRRRRCLHLRHRVSAQAKAPRHPRPRQLRRPLVPLGALGPLRAL
jgi:phytoene dehydrogenase-like protein